MHTAVVPVIIAVGNGFTVTVRIFVEETVSQANPLNVEIANLLYWVLVNNPDGTSYVSVITKGIVAQFANVIFVLLSHLYVRLPSPVPETLPKTKGSPPEQITWLALIEPFVTLLMSIFLGLSSVVAIGE